jgi:hypothetical protein
MATVETAGESENVILLSFEGNFFIIISVAITIITATL